MKLKARWALLVLALLFSACAQGGGNPASGSADVPPTPYPDTPAPAAIEAALIEAPALVELEMLNELDGWGVSETGIVRTNDGGVTWYTVTPPDVAETGYSVNVFFLDADHAWMQKPDFENFPSSGFLYRTTDGGIQWQNSKVPFSQADIHFLNENDGWALVDLGIGAGSNAVAVYQTTDGGQTWDRTYTNDPNDSEAGDSLPLGGLKSGIVAQDMKTAWVSGVIYAPGEVYLFRTDDGGRSWDQISLPLPDNAENFELGIDEAQMKFVSDSDGFLAIRMSGDATQTAVYVTHDAGNTWDLAPTLINGAGESEFLSAEEAVIYNGEEFYVTHDAARSWVTVSPDVKFGESFAGMEFANPTTGWVITMDPTTNHRSLYKTTDGGTTWFPVIP